MFSIGGIVAWFVTSKTGQTILLVGVALLAVLGFYHYAKMQGRRQEAKRNAERVVKAEKKMRNVKVPRNEQELIDDLESGGAR